MSDREFEVLWTETAARDLEDLLLRRLLRS